MTKLVATFQSSIPFIPTTYSIHFQWTNHLQSISKSSQSIVSVNINFCSVCCQLSEKGGKVEEAREGGRCFWGLNWSVGDSFALVVVAIAA